LLALSAVAVVGLAACSSGNSGDSGSSGTSPTGSGGGSSTTSGGGGGGGGGTGTYKWALSIAISSMDPATTPNVYDYVYLWPTYDRLTNLNDDTGQPEPMLAKSWEVAKDGTSLTLTLRDDVTYQDGTKFDADSVKQNLDRETGDAKSTIKGQLSNVASVAVVDPTTVKITMKGATAGPMPSILGGIAGMMVSPKSFSDANLKSIGVGAGPYKVTSNDGTTIQYAKYDGYYDKSRQTVANIEATALPDDQTRLNAAISGAEDGVFIRGGQIADAKAAGLTVVTGQTPTPNGLELNMTRAKFADVRVRQAINYALDRQAIATAAFGDNCTPNTQLFASTFWAYDKSLQNAPTYDVAKAKDLMAQAGLSSGFTFEITSPNIPAWVTMITAIQDQLSKIGITVKLNVVAGAAGNTAFWVDHTADALTSADPFIVDPSTFIQQYFGASGLRNVANYSNPQLNDLATKATTTTDQTQRQALYAQIQQIVTDQALSPIVICNQTTAWAFRKGVDGFKVSVNGMWDYSKITVPSS
jgi:ABC-type transport system substrate-binding protein